MFVKRKKGIEKQPTKYKKFPISETLDKRLKEEVKESGITGNTIVILALDSFLRKKEKERK